MKKKVGFKKFSSYLPKTNTMLYCQLYLKAKKKKFRPEWPKLPNLAQTSQN